MRDHSLRIDFVLAEEYDVMKDRYNSNFHLDMKHVGQCEYDGVDTWLEAVRSTFGTSLSVGVRVRE